MATNVPKWKNTNAGFTSTNALAWLQCLHFSTNLFYRHVHHYIYTPKLNEEYELLLSIDQLRLPHDKCTLYYRLIRKIYGIINSGFLLNIIPPMQPIPLKMQEFLLKWNARPLWLKSDVNTSEYYGKWYESYEKTLFSDKIPLISDLLLRSNQRRI